MPTILIADDNEEMLDTLERIFGLYNFTVTKALDGREAVEKARSGRPDIIILDGMMPEMDGFEACGILKKDETTKDIPVVFLTANYMELRDRLKGLELGADDYLLKPFNSKNLVLRIKSILKRTQEARQLWQDNYDIVSQNSAIEDRIKELIEQHKSDEVALVDPDTGLYSKTFFMLRLNQELERHTRYGNELSTVFITIENHEKLRENLGPILSGYLLIKVGNYILKHVRSIDLLACNGQDGFLLMLPQTADEGACAKIETLHEILNRHAYLEGDVLKTLEFSRKKLSDITKMVFKYGIASTADISDDRDSEAFVRVAIKRAVSGPKTINRK